MLQSKPLTSSKITCLLSLLIKYSESAVRLNYFSHSFSFRARTLDTWVCMRDKETSRSLPLHSALNQVDIHPLPFSLSDCVCLSLPLNLRLPFFLSLNIWVASVEKIYITQIDYTLCSSDERLSESYFRVNPAICWCGQERNTEKRGAASCTGRWEV